MHKTPMEESEELLCGLVWESNLGFCKCFHCRWLWSACQSWELC